jgi:hypothetical protein
MICLEVKVHTILTLELDKGGKSPSCFLHCTAGESTHDTRAQATGCAAKSAWTL